MGSQKNPFIQDLSSDHLPIAGCEVIGQVKKTGK